MTRLPRGLALALMLSFAALTASPPRAQQAVTPEEAAREAESRREQRAERDAELKAAEERQRANAAARARIEQEIREVRADRARLNQSLIEATRRSQASEARAAEIEARLDALATSERAIRLSLDARRGLVGDVLAALQRMGRRPPPAVLIQPEDVLSAVRAAILMGAVLPELRSEAEQLAVDLQELVRLRARMAEERDAVRREFDSLAAERQRLAALIEARRQREAEAARWRMRSGGAAAPSSARSRTCASWSNASTGRRRRPRGSPRRPAAPAKPRRKPSANGWRRWPSAIRRGSARRPRSRTCAAACRRPWRDHNCVRSAPRTASADRRAASLSRAGRAR